MTINHTPLGINVGEYKRWSPEIPFLNLLKGGQVLDHALDVDNDGYPTSSGTASRTNNRDSKYNNVFE